MKTLLFISLVLCGCGVMRGSDEPGLISSYSSEEHEYLYRFHTYGLIEEFYKLTTSQTGKYEKLRFTHTYNSALNRVETSEISIECGTYNKSGGNSYPYLLLTPENSTATEYVGTYPGEYYGKTWEIYKRQEVGFIDSQFFQDKSEGKYPFIILSPLIRCNLN